MFLLRGDFNTCLRPEDRYPRLLSKDSSASALQKLMSKCNLTDTWSYTNKDKSGYTYYDKQHKSYSRLDYIFVSKKSYLDLKGTTISEPVKQPGVMDHNALKAVFIYDDLPHGPGYWKLNNNVLKEEAYVEEIYKVVKHTIADYKDINSSQILWEVLKIHVKEYTIQYCTKKKNEKSCKLKSIQKQLDELNIQISALETKGSLTKVDKDILISNKTRKLGLERLQFKYIEQKAKGNCIRSRAKWVEEGELSSKYFLGLEKQRQSGNVIRKLRVGDKFVNENNKILEETTKYYQSLYSGENVSLEKINNYLQKFQNLKKVNKEQQNFCDKAISKNELREVVKNLKKNKAPGLDGLTNEFYQTFWDILEPVFINRLQESFIKGILTRSIRKAVMTLIFNNGDKTMLSNYRYMSFTNSVIKFWLLFLQKDCKKCVQQSYLKIKVVISNEGILVAMQGY